MNLYNYIEEVYSELIHTSDLNKDSSNIIKANSFEKLINDDKQCLNLIFSILELPSETVSINRYRASHIVVTWLMGIGFGNLFKLEKTNSVFNNLFYKRLWLQSAMLHDYGYFCSEINKPSLAIERLVEDYNLLTDNYKESYLRGLQNMSLIPEFRDYFSYQYNEIINYYNYSQEYHKQSKGKIDDEKSDHGIVGACVAFKKYCRNIKTLIEKYGLNTSDTLTQIQKVSCIIAASHNIFKSDNKTQDEKYIKFGLGSLLSTSPIRIKKENNLLSMLSLVDTIECTKRFSRKNNPSEYLIQGTTLKYVDLNLLNNEIIINFERLNEYLLKNRKSKTMSDTLKKHIDAIAKLGSWTDFNSYIGDNDKEVRISIK